MSAKISNPWADPVLMDPSEVLSTIRDLLSEIDKRESDNSVGLTQMEIAAIELAGYFRDLDDWMESGGDLPSQWAEHQKRNPEMWTGYAKDNR
jgi:hypothetical protein